MKKSIVLLLASILMLFGCENSTDPEQIPFEVSMLYPPTLYNGDTLSVVLKFSENDESINSTDDIKIFISSRVQLDTLSVIGLLKRYGDTREEIGDYKYHGIDKIAGCGIIVQGVFLWGYGGVYDLEVVIGGQRVKSKEKLDIIPKR